MKGRLPLRGVCSVDSLRGLVKPRNLELRAPKAVRDAIAGQGAHDGLGIFDLAVEHGVDQLVQRHEVHVDELVIIGVGCIELELGGQVDMNDLVAEAAGRARCFIDADNMRAVSVLNLGTIGEPGHADNTATLKLKKTAPFSALLSVNGERNSQKSLAEWIEDWADYLVGFDANGDAIKATKAAAAVRKITIEANQTADFEDNDFSGKRSLMESVEAKTKDIMPVVFEFKCVPFEGLKERPFKLRLSIITGDRPVLVLRIIQLEAVQEEMANEFRDLLVEKFKDSKAETFIGTFTA